MRSLTSVVLLAVTTGVASTVAAQAPVAGVGYGTPQNSASYYAGMAAPRAIGQQAIPHRPGTQQRVAWCDCYSQPGPDSFGHAAPVAGCQPGGFDGASCVVDGHGYAAAPCAAAPPVVAPAPPSAIWGVAVGGIFLARDNSNQHTFSFDDPNEDRQYLDARDVEFDLAPGFEVRLARFDVCAQSAFELVYWQLFPGVQTAEVRDFDLAGNLSAILNYNQLDYNGYTADNSTNNAAIHRLRNDTRVYNFEANCINVSQQCGCGPTLSTLIGFRLFRFDEELQFASSPSAYGFTGAADELYYDIDVENTLVGMQLGGFSEHSVTQVWSAVFGAKAGVFANFAEGRSHIGGAAGTAVINNGPNNGRVWLVENSKTDIAMLAELSAGVVGQFNCNWRAGVEYRLIGVAGLAQPANQIYHDVRGINDVELLKTNGSLLLHGGFVSLERLF